MNLESPAGQLVTRHMCQSIRGPLMNWTDEEWRAAVNYITKNDGSKYSSRELKMAFLEELSKGHEVIPMGQCDNFDWKTGCQGHAQ